jgi:predicted HicB family RNase H-like nuclease
MKKMQLSLPPELHRELKIEAAAKSTTMQRLAIEMIQRGMGYEAPTDEGR